VYKKNHIINYNKNRDMNLNNKNTKFEYEQYNVLNKYNRRRYNKFNKFNKFSKKTEDKRNIINESYIKNNNWNFNKNSKYNFNSNFQLNKLLKPFKTGKNYSLKRIKNIGKLRNPIKPEEMKENETDMQRYLNIYELYNKRKHLCFI
jgi:hypothetical protein